MQPLLGLLQIHSALCRKLRLGHHAGNSSAAPFTASWRKSTSLTRRLGWFVSSLEQPILAVPGMAHFLPSWRASSRYCWSASVMGSNISLDSACECQPVQQASKLSADYTIKFVPGRVRKWSYYADGQQAADTINDSATYPKSPPIMMRPQSIPTA